MKTLSKKIIIYVICGLMTFSVVSTSYYKSVHAMEWIGGALAFEEALKWLMAAIGITATAGMTDAYWSQYGDDFEDYCTEQNITNQEVTEWQMKLCQGILDKGSECWSAFKSWTQGLISGSSGGGASDIGGWSNGTFTGSLLDFFNTIGVTYNGNIDTSINISVPVAVKIQRGTGDSMYYRCTLFSNVAQSDYSFNSNYSLHCNNVTGGNMIEFTYNNSDLIVSDLTIYNSSGYTVSLNGYISYIFGFNPDVVSFSPPSYWYNWSIFNSGGVADENFQSVTNDVSDLDVISDNGVDEADPEVALPYPGLSDSDNTASKDAYDNIIDAINDGTITIDEGIERIQEIIRVITYDTVTDDVIPVKPDPDTGENKKKDDVIKENKENSSFGLNGLQNIFPFCIPFDIYSFMNLLVADPVAPEFDFPIKSVNGRTEQIHVDLEPFEPVAVVVRYVFDFLFIVGLGLMTRSMIGGGGSD